jgi:hypothetical protein
MKIEISQDELEILKDVYKFCNALSSNPKDYSCMTDHCHIENDMLYSLILRIENEN